MKGLKMKYLIFILALVVLIGANWPYVVKVYFPYNLPFCFVGGFFTGWYGCKLLFG